MCKLNPIITSDKDKDPSACTAFSSPCGPLHLKSAYSIKHVSHICYRLQVSRRGSGKRFIKCKITKFKTINTVN